MTWQLHTCGARDVARPDVPDWITGPHALGTDPQGRLRPDRLYPIRPDQFVAASIPLRQKTIDHAQLRSVMTAHFMRFEQD
jgi:hypothetical protein